MTVEAFKKHLDKCSAELLDTKDKRRTHLGASQVGGRCARQAWYGFRKVHRTSHGGRILRLFDRGHEEEHRVVRWLRAAGVEVQDYAQRLMYHDGSDSYTCIDWEDDSARAWAECDDVSDDPLHIKRATERKQGPRQWHFAIDIDMEPMPILDVKGNPAYTRQGHYCGSSDGRLRGIETWFPQTAQLGWGLFENKTHNEKSFNNVTKKGLISGKPEHYVQMMQYMHFMGLKWGLYCAVNKNTDDIYTELVLYKPEVAEMYAKRALDIVQQRTAPPKLTEDPSWFECKFCDFREVCHYDKEPQTSCFSCAFARPVKDGKWHCSTYNEQPPEDFLWAGCNTWTPVK